ncbi:LPS-assembly protein LptD [Uliginosibacterium sp. H3]|uniref:LPS-assembly protein LptD n=1 Tax=Uliginosibacterium silvisoli TaxID=3114758 RepID=A0ABU6K125_9RHOO|nr:LPS-assembly protein LptD [Uliginosibacterium sp. H3]
MPGLRSDKNTPRHAVRDVPPRISHLGLAVLACFSGLAVAADGDAFVVRPHLLMFAQLGPVAAPSGTTGSARPDDIFIDADTVDGRTALEVSAGGKVRLRRGDMTIFSDRLRFDQALNEANAEGNVRMLRGQDSVEGPRARMNLDTKVGEFESPDYRFQRVVPVKGVTPGTPYQQSVAPKPVVAAGKADVLEMLGENQYHLRNASYTTCEASDPDWYLRVRDLDLDYDRERGEGTNSVLYFKNVPIGYVPWMDFPLNGSRQSGLLPATFGSTTNTGLDLTLPYYINLAPNYDATIAPRWMGRRGLQLGGEFRYLTPTGYGKMSGEYLANDQVTNTQRGLFSTQNFQDFGGGLTGNVDFSQVSDRNYFADLSSRISSTSQGNLNQQVQLNYGGIAWLPMGVNVQRYQTLTGDTPYSRQPQLTAALNVPDVKGVSVRMPMDYTHFEHPTKDEGQRTVGYPQLAYPVQITYGFFTPKIGVHLSQYDLSRRTTTGPEQLSRAVPIGSIDTGLNFERGVKFGGEDYTQTLEPRFYYVRAASRDQSQFPVFDTARADFNFAQLFSENLYSGSDRISDANQLTSAVTSRFIADRTGAEYIRLALGQRFYFSDQKVYLPGETPREGRIADWLGQVSGRVTTNSWVDTLYQYNPRDHRTERGVLAVRYQPQSAKVVTASYRYQRTSCSDPLNAACGTRDIDFATQWPIYGGWYGVGRYNRNLKDHQLSEALAGLEYKADCWVLRMVWQTLLTTKTDDPGSTTSKQSRNNSVFLQLEFNGLASIGSNPVQLLKRSIGGYSKINDNGVGDPVFGTGSAE